MYVMYITRKHTGFLWLFAHDMGYGMTNRLYGLCNDDGLPCLLLQQIYHSRDISATYVMFTNMGNLLDDSPTKQLTDFGYQTILIASLVA